MMGVVTVFLTVSFITFLASTNTLAPILALNSAVFTCGDFDLVITGNTNNIESVNGNTNYYHDQNEFFGAPYLTQSEKLNKETS